MGYAVFNVNEWTNTVGQYKKNDIVSYGGKYYYALADHTPGASFSADLSKGLWGGRTIFIDNKEYPHFFWVPSNSSAVKVDFKVLNIEYGNGYSKRINDGINNTRINLSLEFAKRDNFEARAILHFLYVAGGGSPFIFTPAFPFNEPRKFVCNSCTHVPHFDDCNTINCEFSESN